MLGRSKCFTQTGFFRTAQQINLELGQFTRALHPSWIDETAGDTELTGAGWARSKECVAKPNKTKTP